MHDHSEIRSEWNAVWPPGSADPVVTVVIASVNGLPYPIACLEALENQSGGIPIEVVLVDRTGASTVSAVRERFPWVRILERESHTSVPILRAHGLLTARAKLVAITEDHCVPRSDWIQNLVDVHRITGWAAVGGGVVNGSVDRAVDWAAFFCEYGHLIDPVPHGEAVVVPGMNVVYDMEALESERDVLGKGLWENFLHDHLRQNGHLLGLDPSIVVSHDKYFTVSMFIYERFHLSRAFAGHRIPRARRIERLGWAAGALALPPILVARIMRNVWRRPQYRGDLLRALPLVVFFSVVWALGESVGYLAGPGDSMDRIR